MNAATPAQAAHPLQSAVSALQRLADKTPMGNWDEPEPAEVALRRDYAQAALDEIAAQEPHAAITGPATDLPAISAYAAHYELDADAARAEWPFIADPEQARWRAVAGAVAACIAPELAGLRERLEAAEAAKRAAKGELAALGDRLAQAIATAVKAERARIRELADRSGAVCTGDEGTSHYFSALLAEPAMSDIHPVRITRGRQGKP